MSIRSSVGIFLQSKGERLVQKELERQYGKQIGKVANNGSKAFQRKVGEETVVTGLTWDNKVIAEVMHKGDKIKGITKRIKRNRDGDIVEVSTSKMATNYRNNISQNLETGEVKSKVFDTGVKDNHPQHQITTTIIDKSGKVNSSTKDVKINGKNHPTEQA